MLSPNDEKSQSKPTHILTYVQTNVIKTREIMAKSQEFSLLKGKSKDTEEEIQNPIHTLCTVPEHVPEYIQSHAPDDTFER